MSKLIGLDKLANFFRIIKANGGIIGCVKKQFRMDDLKFGTLIGTDKYGNRYFENKMYFTGRNRWVEYSEHENLNYDGSQVPAEWFGWLHYKTDLKPHEDPTRPKYRWMMDHVENKSGSTQAYMPYTTTRSKVEAWQPPKK